MFLPDEILLEILRFLNWNELGIISVTTRQNYRIVRKYFPHRILWNKILFLEWENLETKLTLFDVTSNEYFIPTTRQWQKNGQQVQVLNIENLEPPYGLCEMGPFLNETMRVPKVFLYVPNRLCATQDMDDLLSLTHLWSDRELTLYIDYIDPIIHFNSWMDQLLTTPNLLQCQQLSLDYSENMVPFYPHPNIYKLRLLKIMCWFIDDKNILELIESKRMYPDSNTVFVLWYTEGKLSTLVEIIGTSFLASSMELQFRIIAAVNANDDIPISEFCLINSNIKEMLKLKKLAPHEYESKPPEYDEEGLLKCPWDICQVDGSFPPYCNKGEVCKPCWHFTFFGACVDENASEVTRTTDNYQTNEPETSILPLNRTDVPATQTLPPPTHTNFPTTYTSPASFEPQIPCDPGNSNTCPEEYVCMQQGANNKCVRVEASITPVTHRTSPSTSPQPHRPKPYPINCPENFAEVGKYNRCLLYQEDPKTLTNAHRKCLADGGALASASPEMSGFDKMKEIALNKSNGSPVNIWHEYIDGKQRWKPHCIAFPKGKCDPEKQTKLPYFCEYYKVNPCGGSEEDMDRWHYRDGQCFKTVSNPNGMSFEDARKTCQALGGAADVAVINSMGKNELLRRLLEEENLMDPDYEHHDPLDNAWIGLFHDGKKLQWVDGEEEKILLEEDNKGKYPWAPGEPGLDSNEKCTEVKTGEQGLWNDLFCSQPLRAAICSRKFSLQP